MGYKSFSNLLFDLSKASSKEEKRELMHNYIYKPGGMIDFIYLKEWNDVSPPKTKRVYYITDIVNPFLTISQEEIEGLNEIFLSVQNNKKTKLTPEIKKILINYFNIRKSSEIPNVRYFYYFCYELLNEEIKNNYQECFIISEEDNYNLSLLFKEDRIKELNINNLNDLNNKMLNKMEIDNIKSYLKDQKQYVVNDKLFSSLLSKECENIVIEYFKEGTFSKTGAKLNISTTKTRLLFYQSIKAVVDFFYSKDGVRALWLMFSSGNGFIKREEIEEKFLKYSNFIKFIFDKRLIYNIKYDKDRDGYLGSRSIKMIKLVGFDLDDTLLNSKKEIQDIKAIKELVKNNIKICFCSGRPYVETVKNYYKKIGLTEDIYYVAFNGVAVYKIDNDELIYGNYLKEDEIKIISDVVNKEIKDHFKEEDFAMYCYKMDNTVVSTRINDYVMLEEKFNKTKIVVGEFWHEDICGHKIMISGEPELIKKLFSFIYDKLKDDFEVLISMPFFIEVYKKNNDKYQSLLKVAKEYGIEADEIMTFGDSLNDYTLVKNGEIGIAMGNSVKKIKEVATYVTDDNDHYGVTKALIKYGLIKKSNHLN